MVFSSFLFFHFFFCIRARGSKLLHTREPTRTHADTYLLHTHTHTHTHTHKHAKHILFLPAFAWNSKSVGIQFLFSCSFSFFHFLSNHFSFSFCLSFVLLSSLRFYCKRNHAPLLKVLNCQKIQGELFPLAMSPTREVGRIKPIAKHLFSSNHFRIDFPRNCECVCIAWVWTATFEKMQCSPFISISTLHFTFFF